MVSKRRLARDVAAVSPGANGPGADELCHSLVEEGGKGKAHPGDPSHSTASQKDWHAWIPFPWEIPTSCRQWGVVAGLALTLTLAAWG